MEEERPRRRGAARRAKTRHGRQRQTNRWRLYLFGGAAALLAILALLRIVLQPTSAVPDNPAPSPWRDDRPKADGVVGSSLRPAASVRGAIFDATGQLLAGDVSYESLYADPIRVTSPDKLAATLAPVLDAQEGDLVRRLSARQREAVLVQAGLTAEQSAQVRRLARPELQLRTDSRRSYPEGKLAAGVLGVVGRDGRGLTGMEAGFDTELSGRLGPGREAAYRGADLVLTLDRYAQRIAETELAQGVAANRASGGVVLVMEPSTGAVLAMAASPTFDPKQMQDDVQLAAYRQPSTSAAYEPVSLMRAVTIAAAIDAGAIEPDHTYLNRSGSPPRPTPAGASAASTGAEATAAITSTSRITATGRITDTESLLAAGTVSPSPENMTQVVQRASEAGTAYVANRMGVDTFYRYMARFGFGQPTGVGLADENGGMVGPQANPGYQAFGQGILVTPLQLAAAMSVIANGGLLMQPYLVQELRIGEVRVPYDPRLVRQVVSPAAARAVKSMLLATVAGPEATAAQAALPPYPVAGLASAPGTSAGSAESATFVGFLPAENPRFTILVKLDRPQTGLQGAEVAAPVFRAVAQQLVAYYRVAPPNAVAAVPR